MQDITIRPSSPSLADERLARSQELLIEELRLRGNGAAWLAAALSHAPSRLDERYLTVIRQLGLCDRSSVGYTYGHSERVAWYAAEVAAALGMDEAEIDAVRFGAYLHDVGKLRVPHGILSKAGVLTPAEYEVVKKHAAWGVEMLERVDLPTDVRPAVRWHHERFDGSGYPDGLAGDAIPMHPAIIAIADVYDALTSSRSYRPALSSSAALAVMRERRGWWRPEVYAAFCRAAASSARTASALLPAPALVDRHRASNAGRPVAA